MTDVSLQLRSAVFPGFDRSLHVIVGGSVEAMLRQGGVTPEMDPHTRVLVNGEPLDRAFWSSTVPSRGQIVNVMLAPMGGQQLMDENSWRVLAVLASQLGGKLVGQALGGVGGYFVGTAISMAGAWLAFTLIPQVNRETDPVLSVSSLRNETRPGEAVPKIYGTRRIVPPLAALPVTEVAGDEQYLMALFALGSAPLSVDFDAVKFGNLPVSQIPDLEIEVNDGFRHFDKITLYGGNVAEQFMDVRLNYAKTWRVYVATGGEVPNEADDAVGMATNSNVLQLMTTTETRRISVDFTFPDGIGELSGDTLFPHSIGVSVQYRPRGTDYAAWHDVAPPRVQPVVNLETASLSTANLFTWISRVVDALDPVVTTLEGLSNLSLSSQRAFMGAFQREHAQTALGLTKILLRSWSSGEQAVLDDALAVMNRMGSIVAEVLADTDDHLDVDSAALAALHEASRYEGILDDLLGMLGYRKAGVPDKIIEKLRVYKHLQQQMQTEPAIFGNLAADGFMFDNRDQKRGVIRRNVSWPVHEGEYEVRIRKSTPDQSGDFLDTVNVTAFRSIRQGQAVRADALERLAVIAIRVKASDVLSGALEQFNCVVTSPLFYTEDGETVLGPGVTDTDGLDIARNPAWQLVDALSGPSTKRPVGWSRIDWSRIYEFATWCRSNNFHTDLVVDRRVTLQSVLDDICRPAKASPCVRDGKYSIVHDIAKEQSRAVITLRNTAGFTASKILADRPNALRIWCVNPALDWADDSLMVYDDGYGDGDELIDFTVYVTANADALRVEAAMYGDIVIVDTLTGRRLGSSEYTVTVGADYTSFVNNAATSWGTEFARYKVAGRCIPRVPDIIEDVKFPGLVDTPGYPENTYFTGQAYKLGRYLLKALEHRPEVFEVVQDWENLVYERGDQVDLQMDMVRWGIGAGRVTAVTQFETAPGSGQYYVVSLSFDEKMPMEDGYRYAVKVRGANGQVSPALDVSFEAGWHSTVDVIDRAPAVSFAIQAGDLVFWGARNNITVPCIVRDITHQRDLTAVVTLIQASPLIHLAEQGAIPPYDPQISHVPAPALALPPRPVLTSIVSGEAVSGVLLGDAFDVRIQMTLSYYVSDPGNLSVSSIAAIDVEYRPSWFPDAQWIESGTFAGAARIVYAGGLLNQQRYDVRVRSRTRGGLASEWTEAHAIMAVGNTTPPPDVAVVWIEGRALSWLYSPPVDHAGFEVRAFIGEGGSWDVAAPMHGGVLLTTTLDVGPASRGIRTFFVKAVDVAGNKSVNAASISETADGDAGFFVLEADSFIVENYSWPGTKSNMSEDAGDLKVDAGDKDEFYHDLGSSPYQDLADPAYSTDYPEASFETGLTMSGPTPPRYLDCEVTVSGGGDWRLERCILNPDLWIEGRLDQWPGTGSEDYWPVEGDWGNALSPVPIIEDKNYRFRVNFQPSNTQGVIEHMKLRVLARRISETLRAAEIADDWTEIALTRDFNAFTSITATIVSDSGADPDAVRAVAKVYSGAVYVKTYDSSGIGVEATVDIYVEGY